MDIEDLTAAIKLAIRSKRLPDIFAVQALSRMSGARPKSLH
jgi:hypothetical protein